MRQHAHAVRDIKVAFHRTLQVRDRVRRVGELRVVTKGVAVSSAPQTRGQVWRPGEGQVGNKVAGDTR